MGQLIIPKGYSSPLSVARTQEAIEFTRSTFQDKISKALNLKRTSAPLFVAEDSGINDDLNGYERPVRFDIKATGKDAVIVHSLAKWKRMALAKYEFKPGEGLYTDMNAIRRDEELDNLHSCYVDQWDWEKVILKEDRSLAYLQSTVKSIVNAICDTLDAVRAKYPEIKTELCREVYFVSADELARAYPELTPSEREAVVAREYKTVFISGIGKTLCSGERHDGRAPDYDDWDLNGDIIFWNDVIDRQFEVSSMGIRVDAVSLAKQLKLAECEGRMKYEYHKGIADGTLPLTIGGGIGQSRICMLLLGKAHIGEVQVSIWSDEMIQECRQNGINLL